MCRTLGAVPQGYYSWVKKGAIEDDSDRVIIAEIQDVMKESRFLKRRFTVAEPNRVWVSDITYLKTRDGWLYLCVWLDLFSRGVVG